MLFGCTEEEVAENFFSIADEILAFSAVDGKRKSTDNGPYAGWKLETMSGLFRC